MCPSACPTCTPRGRSSSGGGGARGGAGAPAPLPTPRPPLTRAVVERVIHSAADLDYATDLVMAEDDLVTAHAALHAGAPVVVDVEMVAAGITRRETVCRLKDAKSGPGLTRSAHAVRL